MLFRAVRLAQREKVAELLKKNVDPNSRDYVQRTPIFYARDRESFQLLLSAGAQVGVNELENEGNAYFNDVEKAVLAILKDE